MRGIAHAKAGAALSVSCFVLLLLIIDVGLVLLDCAVIITYSVNMCCFMVLGLCFVCMLFPCCSLLSCLLWLTCFAGEALSCTRSGGIQKCLEKGAQPS